MIPITELYDRVQQSRPYCIVVVIAVVMIIVMIIAVMMIMPGVTFVVRIVIANFFTHCLWHSWVPSGAPQYLPMTACASIRSNMMMKFC